MRNSTRGSYTLEAAIFLPFVVLAVLSLGYFMRVDGLWENCIHGAVDESSLISSKSYDNVRVGMVGYKVEERLRQDNPRIDNLEIKNVRVMYRDLYGDNLTSYRIKAQKELELPLGFDREFNFDVGIKYRGFTGKVTDGKPMGSNGLENNVSTTAVYIFPNSGEKYHEKNCTHVKASVKPVVLNSKIKSEYRSCGLCKSADIAVGNMVFCFEGEDTAYHRGKCKSIVKHTVVIDKKEALKKGYDPCSKCGGG